MAVSPKFTKKLKKCKLEKDPQKKITSLSKVLGKFPEQSEVYFEIAEHYKKSGVNSLKTNSSPTEGEQILKKPSTFIRNPFKNVKALIIEITLISVKSYFL